MIRPLFLVLVPCSLAIAQHTQPGTSVIRRVPQDFGTIQQAIDISNNGDTVLVTMSQDYNESPSIDKNIKVTAKANSGPGRLLGRFTITGAGPSMQLRGFTITSSETQVDGGGLLINGGSPTIRECTIQNCTINGWGGGIAVFDAGPDIRNCKILNNTSHGGSGGGIFALRPNNMLVLNCFISGNSVDGPANGNGGGLHLDSGVTTIRNCTITNNVATHVAHGGGIYCTGVPNGGQVTLQNSIVWNNTTEAFPLQQISVQAFCLLDVSFTDIMNGFNGITVGTSGTLIFGAGNLNADPLFVDGLHITTNPFSPCLNAGNTSLMTAGEVDIDLQSRLFSTNIDMGCDEFVIAP